MASHILQGLEDGVIGAIATARSAVVTIGRGTGIVVAPDTVLTNAHNLHHDEPRVHFADGRTATGSLAGADIDGDLAIVTVDTGDADPLTPATAPPRHGQLVVALARPRHRGLVATAGTVAAVDARFRGPRGRIVSGAFEHDARMPRGGSGGPVLDLDGSLLGIDTHRRSDGFYVALAATELSVDRLRQGDVPARPRLGIGVAPASVARRLRAAVGLDERDGVLVREVEPDSPAAAAGIRAGDLLVAAGDDPLTSVERLQDAVATADGSLRLTVVRGTDERQVTVEVGSTEGSPS